MSTQQHSESGFIDCIDALCDSIERATSLAHVVRMAAAQDDHEDPIASREATAEVMRIVIELMDTAKSAKNRIHELHRNFDLITVRATHSNSSVHHAVGTNTTHLLSAGTERTFSASDFTTYSVNFVGATDIVPVLRLN